MAESELKYELDPNIWGKAPHDVLLNIIEHSDLSTQINWSCTSRVLFLDASYKIWGSLCVYGSEIMAYAFLVSGKKPPGCADSIVHFLMESAYRRHNTWDHVFAKDRTFIHRPNGVSLYQWDAQLIATLPVSHVKDFEIDNQGLDEHHPICNQRDMDLVLPFLLRRLQKLQSFRYIGPLSARNLAVIIRINTLRVLQVRNSNDVFEDMPFTPTRTVTMPWSDPVLDWSVLANLKSLRALEVGRLTYEEAEGLAKGLSSLNLRRLHVSCWGWEYKNMGITGFRHHTSQTSALIMFLDTLMTLDLREGQAFRGLPSTLEHLVLIDKYHAYMPSLYQLLTTAILPCKDLESMDTTFSVNRQGYVNISKMGLPAHHKIVGLNSWQQLSNDEEIKVLHEYQSPSGKKLRTSPYPRPLRNIAKTVDQVLAATEGSLRFRMSMNFVRGRQFRSDEILVYPCEGEDSPSVAEEGPQGDDPRMMDLASRFASLSLDEHHWQHMVRTWGMWSDW